MNNDPIVADQGFSFQGVGKQIATCAKSNKSSSARVCIVGLEEVRISSIVERVCLRQCMRNLPGYLAFGNLAMLLLPKQVCISMNLHVQYKKFSLNTTSKCLTEYLRNCLQHAAYSGIHQACPTRASAR